MEKVTVQSTLQVFNGGVCARIHQSRGIKPDFNIIAGNVIFPAHKIIFGIKSKFLLELFMKTYSGPVMYIMEDVSPSDMENLLMFVYEGKITVKPSQSAGLLHAAKQLKIDVLINELEKRSLDEARKDADDTFSGMPILSIEEPYLPNDINDHPIFAPLLNLEDLFQAPLDSAGGFSKSTSIHSMHVFRTVTPDQIPLSIPVAPQQIPLSTPNEPKKMSPPHVFEGGKQNQEEVHCGKDVTAITTTVKRRGKCKHPRIPTPFPFSKVASDAARWKNCPATATAASPLMKRTAKSSLKKATNIRQNRPRRILSSTKVEHCKEVKFCTTPERPTRRKLGEAFQIEEKLPAPPKFCLADLIEGNNNVSKVERPGNQDVEYITEKSSNVNNIPSAIHPSPPNELLILNEQPMQKKFKKQVPPPRKPICISSTFSEDEFEEGKKDNESRSKGLPKSIKGTKHDSSDDSSFFVELRRKLPISKRRRIPASTRMVLSSTSSNSDSIPAVYIKPKKPKPKIP